MVHADQLRLVARHGEDSVAAATVIEPAGAVSLPSGGTVPVVMSVLAGSGVTSVGFAVGGLSLDLDPPAALYEAVLDRTTSVAWTRSIDVNVARTLFDGVAVLQVDLDDADAISIPAPEAGAGPFLPAVKVTVHLPMKSVLVGSEVSTDVRYRVRRLLADGSKLPWTDYVTDDTGGESLFISALPTDDRGGLTRPAPARP